MRRSAQRSRNLISSQIPPDLCLHEFKNQTMKPKEIKIFQKAFKPRAIENLKTRDFPSKKMIARCAAKLRDRRFDRIRDFQLLLEPTLKLCTMIVSVSVEVIASFVCFRSTMARR
jgi:hypothetical protein